MEYKFQNYEDEIMPILLSKINKFFNKQYDELLKPYSLSKIHAFYLMCLHKFEQGLKLTELNKIIGCDKANTSRAISDLEGRGMLVREGADCEKKYSVKLTKAGFEVASKFVEGSNKFKLNMLKNLNESEQQELFVLLKKVLKNGEENDTN